MSKLRLLVLVSSLASFAIPLSALAGDPALNCAASKLKASGKEAAGALTCYAKSTQKDVPVDAECLEKTDAKFDEAFEKADAKGGCLETGDAADVDAVVHALVASVLAEVPVEPGTPTPEISRDCSGNVYLCGDTIDNDGDGLIDANDPECMSACDNDEEHYDSAIPGVTPGCTKDCFWDSNGGPGDDDCAWTHVCDLHGITSGGTTCTFNGSATVGGQSCSAAFTSQSAECESFCGPLVPNGCDCFGCCELPDNSGTYAYVGTQDAFSSSTCSSLTVNDPTECQRCIPVGSCFNPCTECEICAGNTDVSPACSSQECPVGVQVCGLPGQPICPAGSYCVTGCCQSTPL